MKIRRSFAAVGLAAVMIFGGAAAANAQTIGNGTTSPSHDESTGVIPLCNPVNTAQWLLYNFYDHGRDIVNYKPSVWTPLDVISYAASDANFHLPQTIASVGGLTDPMRYCLVNYAPQAGS